MVMYNFVDEVTEVKLKDFILGPIKSFVQQIPWCIKNIYFI